jgi:hypothetical protein
LVDAAAKLGRLILPASYVRLRSRTRGVLELFQAKSIGEGGDKGFIRAVTADFVRNPFLGRPPSR